MSTGNNYITGCGLSLHIISPIPRPYTVQSGSETDLAAVQLSLCCSQLDFIIYPG